MCSPATQNREGACLYRCLARRPTRPFCAPNPTMEPSITARACWSATAATTAPGPPRCFALDTGSATREYESVVPSLRELRPGEDLHLEVTLRNSGKRAGREVVQVYLEPATDDAARPVRTLAAFGSVAAEPGESVRVLLTVTARAFAFYDEPAGAWVSQPGAYSIHAGRSSRDLKLQTEVVLQ